DPVVAFAELLSGAWKGTGIDENHPPLQRGRDVGVVCGALALWDARGLCRILTADGYQNVGNRLGGSPNLANRHCVGRSRSGHAASGDGRFRSTLVDRPTPKRTNMEVGVRFA